LLSGRDPSNFFVHKQIDSTEFIINISYRLHRQDLHRFIVEKISKFFDCRQQQLNRFNRGHRQQWRHFASRHPAVSLKFFIDRSVQACQIESVIRITQIRTRRQEAKEEEKRSDDFILSQPKYYPIVKI
jgi:hypothetical protein